MQKTQQRRETQIKKSPQFPMVSMLFNKQLVYAKNAFLEQ